MRAGFPSVAAVWCGRRRLRTPPPLACLRHSACPDWRRLVATMSVAAVVVVAAAAAVAQAALALAMALAGANAQTD